jgi:poly(hydroxyalkanoate) depolymerase family esterase
MKWSRELRIARRSVRTAVRAASAVAASHAKLPRSTRVPSADSYTSAGLVEVSEFGTNPGRLSMFIHLPPDPPQPNAPLIVLLHGCGQTAAKFARDTGWIDLADRLGIPLVLPEQSEANNRGHCFNWFRPMHTGRGLGEALSIQQMVDIALQRFGSDPRRVFVAGLSAGGAMTSALLAAYPDVFAGGGVVAGLPVGAANSVTEALRRMAQADLAPSPAVWADKARRAAPVGYAGPWPRLSIWRGEADRVVDPDNARLLALQWSALQGLDSTAMEEAELFGARRCRWSKDGQPVVELWSLPDAAHDWPPGAAQAMAAFWDLAPD